MATKRKVEPPAAAQLPADERVTVSPREGRPGDPVCIYGEGFGAEGSVTIGGVGVKTKAWRDDRIKFSIPEGSAGGQVVVYTADGYLAGPVLTVV